MTIKVGQVMDKQAEIDAELVKKAIVESFKEALAERRERERLVWIEFMVALRDPVMADNALKEYVQRWEE